MDITLARHTYHPAATMGFLYVGSLVFSTIERPWLNNRPWYSCIPHGTYVLKPYSSPKFPDVYEICDVPNRTHILIHVGNTKSDVQGCIAPGMTYASDRLAVYSSRKAMGTLREVLKHDNHMIEVCFRIPEDAGSGDES